MGHDWIIDVLTDLRTFAVANDLKALAAKLDDTQLVALDELVSHGKGIDRGLLGESASVGRCDCAVGTRRAS